MSPAWSPMLGVGYRQVCSVGFGARVASKQVSETTTSSTRALGGAPGATGFGRHPLWLLNVPLVVTEGFRPTRQSR